MKLVNQQYRAWSDCTVGQALNWWQRLITFLFSRIRVKLIPLFWLSGHSRSVRKCQTWNPGYKTIRLETLLYLESAITLTPRKHFVGVLGHADTIQSYVNSQALNSGERSQKPFIQKKSYTSEHLGRTTNFTNTSCMPYSYKRYRIIKWIHTCYSERQVVVRNQVCIPLY